MTPENIKPLLENAREGACAPERLYQGPARASGHARTPADLIILSFTYLCTSRTLLFQSYCCMHLVVHCVFCITYIFPEYNVAPVVLLFFSFFLVAAKFHFVILFPPTLCIASLLAFYSPYQTLHRLLTLCYVLSCTHTLDHDTQCMSFNELIPQSPFSISCDNPLKATEKKASWVIPFFLRGTMAMGNSLSWSHNAWHRVWRSLPPRGYIRAQLAPTGFEATPQLRFVQE